MSQARLRDAIASLSGTAARLSHLSQRSYQNPYTALAWPEAVDPERDWFSSPELLACTARGCGTASTSARADGSPFSRQSTSTASTSTARRA